MISKNECLSVLISMEDNGVPGCKDMLRKCATNKEVPKEVLKFISDNRGFEVLNFYEFLRKRGNDGKNAIYKNLMNGVTDPAKAATLLSLLLNQILLHCKYTKLPEKFLNEVRAAEITKALNSFFTDLASEAIFTVLQAIKSDIMVLEYIADKRNLEA